MKDKLFLYLLVLECLISSNLFAYNRDWAKRYMETYARNEVDNTKPGWNMHYNWYRRGDCANFASQVLIHGCYKEKVQDWQSKNIPEEIRDKRWCIQLVDKLHEFLVDKLSPIATHSKSNFNKPPLNGLQVGDIIILRNSWWQFFRDPRHTIIVSEITRGTDSTITEITYAGHTTDRWDTLLYQNGKWSSDVQNKWSELNFYLVHPNPNMPKVEHSAPEGEGAEIWKSGREDDEKSGTPTLIIEADDPNAMYGPEGMVVAGQRLEYTVEFENVGEGIAYGVYVTDLLDEDLDDSTLQVSDFIRIDENGNEILTNFDWNYNPTTRMVTVFVDNGGEIHSKCGGKFSVNVNVQSDAQPGTVITNYATVHFPSVPEITPTNVIVSVIPFTTRLDILTDRMKEDELVVEALFTTEDDKPLIWRTINFQINESTYTATTYLDGIARIFPDLSLGTYPINATFSGDGYYYLPATDAGQLEVFSSAITIVDEQGKAISTYTLTTDDSLILYLMDVENNLVEGYWGVLGEIGSCTPEDGTYTVFDPTKPGTGTISATSWQHTDTTGLITVTIGSITSLSITTTEGEECGTYSLTTDDFLPLYLRGHDNDQNFAYFEGTWSVSGYIGTLTNLYATSTIFYPTTVGVGTITAVSYPFSPAVATLIVTLGTTGAISGYVVFDLPRIDGHKGILVTVPGEISGTTTTDILGYFMLSRIPVGIYGTISAYTYGASPLVWNNIIISPGSVTTLGTLTLLNSDANGDLTVDIADFNLLRETFFCQIDEDGWRPEVDFNGDGRIDVTDFGFLRVNFGRKIP